MKRFPPTAGIIGYDFGTKPAFSVTVGQFLGPIKQQDDETPDGPFCHDEIGDHLDVAISGVLPCSGCYTFGGNDYTISWTGVNGVFDAVWDSGLGIWTVVVGSATVTRYVSADGSCVGFDVDGTADAVLQVLCAGNSQMGVLVEAGTILGAVPIFQNTNGVTFDDPLPNVFTAAGCEVLGFGNFPGAYDGVITLSKP